MVRDLTDDDVRRALVAVLRQAATDLVLAHRIASIRWNPPPQLIEWAVALTDLGHDLDTLDHDQETQP